MNDERALQSLKPAGISEELRSRATKYINAAKADNTLVTH